jgi:hypothetical protein
LAKWEIRRSGDGAGEVSLLYTNLITSEQELLGYMEAKAPDAWALSWIFDHAQALLPGDLIQLSNGSVLQFSRDWGQT